MTWSSDRLDDRFHSIDKGLEDLRQGIRVLTPVTTQAAVLEAKVADIERDIIEMKDDVGRLTVDHTEIIRASRTESVKLIATLAAPVIAVAAAVIAAASGVKP